VGKLRTMFLREEEYSDVWDWGDGNVCGAGDERGSETAIVKDCTMAPRGRIVLWDTLFDGPVKAGSNMAETVWIKTVSAAKRGLSFLRLMGLAVLMSKDSTCTPRANGLDL